MQEEEKERTQVPPQSPDETMLDETEKEALKKLKRLERDYISPDSGISSGLALPPARYVYIVGLFVALFLLLYLLASVLESGLKKDPSPGKRLQRDHVEETLKK